MNITQKALKTIGNAAANESTKYAMASVKLETKDGKSRACSTNGRVLAQLSWDDEEAKDLDALVNAKELEAFTKALQKDPSATIQKSERKLSSISDCVDLTSSKDDLRRTVETIDGAFPDTGSVVPTGTPVASVIINPKLFVQVMKALESSTDDVSPAFRIEIHDNGQPLVLRTEANGIKGLGVIMPITEV